MTKVAVLGCGTVGSGVIKMLSDNQEQIARAAGGEVRLGWALDIRPIPVPGGAKWTDQFEDLMGDPDLSIAVETIGGVGVAYRFTKALLGRGVSVVTSNKELVVTHGAELMALACERNAQYLYEASVGGGVPIIRPLCADLGANRIERILGIVNGSTNYLLTRMMESHIAFPAALAEAKALGYVEADPAADIEGHDACRKLAILANAAFGAALSDAHGISTRGIQHITNRDMACAEALGGAIRLIACGERCEGGWHGWVSPALLPLAHPLSRVRDVFNGIMVTGDFVGDVMFYGRGAGSLPTASAVLSDVIEIVRGVAPIAAWGGPAPQLLVADAEPARLMVRIESSLDEQAVRDAALRHMPGARLASLPGMCALLTPEGPISRLRSALASLNGEGLHIGTEIRALL